MDGITDLNCKDGTAHHLVDSGEATHNRSVAGLSSPTCTDPERVVGRGNSILHGVGRRLRWGLASRPDGRLVGGWFGRIGFAG
jgi:hypothetical protein